MQKVFTAGFLVITLLLNGCDTRSSKQVCLDGNTKANPNKYIWTPEPGSLLPDWDGKCSTKVGIRG